MYTNSWVYLNTEIYIVWTSGRRYSKQELYKYFKKIMVVNYNRSKLQSMVI